MRQQTVTLKIVYDELQNDAPMRWDWNLLLDLETATESVEVISASEIENAPETATNEDDA